MKDEELTSAKFSEWASAHARQNGGWKSFLHSNLFTALIIWILSQGVLGASLFIGIYIRTANIVEWKGEASATLKRLDESGSNHSQWVDKEHENKLSELDARLKRVEADTAHYDVLEAENRRLTKDVEELKDEARKK